jgi:Zn-dependent protease with chaperone function
MSSAFPSRTRSGNRSLESGALIALLPALALVPISLVALFVAWLLIRFVADIKYWVFVGGYLAGGLLLFFRPVQRLLLTRLLGARAPTRQESAVLDPVWREVTQAVHLPSQRFVLAVLDADELNAFASGGHLVVVTSYAVEVLPDDELAGVLAHELSHHLGFHTVALTVGLWLSLPVLILARIGFFLQSVARAFTNSFASGSPALTVVGRIVSGCLTVIAWAFLSGVLLSNAIGNVVGQGAEFQADRRVVEMGFGPQLAAALRRFVASGLTDKVTWRERLAVSHPSARTRVARIEALLRRRRADGFR